MEDILHNFIPNVRQSLGGLPYEILTDAQIWAELKRAWAFVENINESENVSLVKKATIALAIYYTYVNYSSLAEDRVGSLPTAAVPKYVVFRDIALSYLRMITSMPLNDKLVVDIELMRRDRGFSGGVFRGVFT